MKYLFEFDGFSYVKKFTGKEHFEDAMSYARRLHDSLQIPIRFYPLKDEIATIISK